MTSDLKYGDRVTAVRTTVKPSYIRKSGEVAPEKIMTKLFEGALKYKNGDGSWGVEWRSYSGRCHSESFFPHEITKQGTLPLWAGDK